MARHVAADIDRHGKPGDVRGPLKDVQAQAGRLAAAENITAELLMEIRREDILPASPAAE